MLRRSNPTQRLFIIFLSREKILRSCCKYAATYGYLIRKIFNQAQNQ